VDGSLPPAASSAAIAESIDMLFRRHDRWLRPLLRLRHGEAVAEDLVHETYLRAAPYAAAGSIKHPKAFLLRIAENLASNERRARRREVVRDSSEPALAAQAIAPCQEQALTLKEIVLALPPELRDVFVLNHVQGLTYQEIAVRLSIPRTTVHHRMRKALERTSRAMRD
jgi:RNA polymerase sigma factor (sigma-70 family)